MSDARNRELALRLLRADSEAEVVGILEQEGLWRDAKCWRLYGDRDGNFSVIGNQQSRPEAALVEKIVNSVDARLMKECLERGIDPTSADAPQSVREAVARFVDGVEPGSETAGEVRFWPRQTQREQARQITLAVTGSKPRQAGGSSITVVDLGEGQHPEKMPETFLSIDRENKLRIPFVQGKFNMGGTGALKFCGRSGLQLVITRRCPGIVEADCEAESRWGFTVARRERPVEGAGEIRNSVYRYLAPVGAEEKPGLGGVLQFSAADIEALPEKNEAYARSLSWGSVLKLYEYDMKGFGSHALMKGGLLGRLELMLPGIALPVRVHECRSFGGDPRRSFETTLLGLSARLEANRANNLEEGFPTSGLIQLADQDLPVEIYAFKPKRADAYRSTEGIVFTINGQTHGAISKAFFSRRRVKMGRLADSLLLMVDCSRLSVDAREDLFMNSRDRLSNGELRKAIESEMEELVGRHHGLRELRDRRRAEEIAQRLEDSKPLEDVLDTLLRSSPSFVLHDGVANWSILLPEGLEVGDEVTLQCTVADDSLIDPFVNLVEISIVPKGQRKSGKRTRRERRLDFGDATDGSGQGGKGHDSEAGIRLPHIETLRERDPRWSERGFDHYTGCEVVDDSDVEKAANGRDLTFYVNMSNRALETDLKDSREDARVVEAKFVYANVLVGLGLLNDPRQDGDDAAESMDTAETRVASTTRALAPLLLPMIDFLGSLGPEDVSAGGVGDED